MRKLSTLLRNLADKIDTSVNMERITNSEIDAMFGSASGTGTNAQDYVVEHSISTNSDGGSQGWTKWASGKMECWVNVIRATNPTTTWGNLKYGNVSTISYGQTFVDNPMVNVVIRNGSLWLLCAYPNKTETGTMYACCAGNVTVGSTSSWVSVYAIGRWK